MDIVQTTHQEHEVAITSLEIAKQTEKRHSDVMRDIRKMLDGLEIPERNFASAYEDSQGQERPMFILPKREAMILASGYSVKLRAKIIDRVEELERGRPQLPDFTNPAIAARAWADEVEAKLKLQSKIAEKDEIITTVAKLNIEAGQVSFANFAKNLALKGMGRNNVIRFCKARGYIMGNTEPYQPYVDRGYFVRKPSKEKINGKTRYTTYLTPRGTVWLARIIKAEFEVEE